MNRKFEEQHVEGKHQPGKPRNQAGNFQDVNFAPLRKSGDPKGARAEGSMPGQIHAGTGPKRRYFNVYVPGN